MRCTVKYNIFNYSSFLLNFKFALLTMYAPGRSSYFCKTLRLCTFQDHGKFSCKDTKFRWQIVPRINRYCNKPITAYVTCSLLLHEGDALEHSKYLVIFPNSLFKVDWIHTNRVMQFHAFLIKMTRSTLVQVLKCLVVSRWTTNRRIA